MIPDFTTIYKPRLKTLFDLDRERSEFMKKIDAIWQSNPINLNFLYSFPNITTIVNQDFSEDEKLFSEGFLLYNAAKDQVQTDEERKKIAGWTSGCKYARDCLIKTWQENPFSKKIEENFLQLEADVRKKEEALAHDLKTLYKSPQSIQIMHWCSHTIFVRNAYLDAIKTRKKTSRAIAAVFLHISQLFEKEEDFKQAKIFSRLSKKYQKKERSHQSQVDRYLNYCNLYSSVLDKRPADFHMIFAGGNIKTAQKELALHLQLFAAQHEHALTFKEQKRLHKCRHQLLQAIEMQSASALDIASKIASLVPGESLIMNVVTATPHWALYKIERMDKDHYLFTIINTGYDELDAHDRQPTGNVFLDTQLYAHKSWKIPQSALTEQTCIDLFGAETAKRDLRTIISAMNAYFLGTSINGQGDLGRLHHFQRHGSCYSKAATSYVHGVLGRSLYERFKAYRTKQLIEKFLTWERSLPLNEREDLYREWTDPQKAIKGRNALLRQTLSRQEAKAAKHWQAVSLKFSGSYQLILPIFIFLLFKIISFLF